MNNLLLFLDQHTLPQITWEVYFARFFLVFWFLLGPILFLFFFMFTRELNKRKRSSVVFEVWKDFKHYGYFFHNLLFIFVLGALSFNTIFLIYSFVDIYIVKFSSFYSLILGLEGKSRETVTEEHQTGFFWGVVFLGYFLNLLSISLYIYYNLYKTDSFFAELWQGFVHKYSLHPYVFALKNKSPKIYSFLNSWFLDVDNIATKSEDKFRTFIIG